MITELEQPWLFGKIGKAEEIDPSEFERVKEAFRSFYDFGEYFAGSKVKNWIKRVNGSKKDIRELLNGRSKTISVSKSETEEMRSVIPLDLIRITKNYQDAIRNMVGAKDVLFTKDSPSEILKNLLNCSNNGLKNPYDVILDGYRDNLDYHHYLNDVYSTITKIKTSRLFDEIYISTDPVDFLKLGHLGPDKGSCFSNNGCNRVHKLYLGQTVNSFVYFTSKNKKVISRGFGFYLPWIDTIVITNHYPVERSQILNQIEIGKILSKDLLGVSKIFVSRQHYISGVYCNKDAVGFSVKPQLNSIHIHTNCTNQVEYGQDDSSYLENNTLVDNTFGNTEYRCCDKIHIGWNHIKNIMVSPVNGELITTHDNCNFVNSLNINGGYIHKKMVYLPNGPYAKYTKLTKDKIGKFQCQKCLSLLDEDNGFYTQCAGAWCVGPVIKVIENKNGIIGAFGDLGDF